MGTAMGRTLAEQENTFRWDREELVLWAGTTATGVAAKWEKAGYAVRVLSRDQEGAPCSWEVKLPWTGSKRPWSRLVSLAMPSMRVPDDALARSSADDLAEDDLGDPEGA